jgi:hypothetical protein
MRFVSQFFFIAWLTLASTLADAETTKSTDSPPTKGGAGDRQPPPATGVTPTASITITCKNGKKFALTTRTTGGKCSAVFDAAENVIGGECEDGNNASLARCGQGCLVATGSSSCSPAE